MYMHCISNDCNTHTHSRVTIYVPFSDVRQQISSRAALHGAATCQN